MSARPCRAVRPCHIPHRVRGFTLIELLVAITILALIAVFSWRGLDQVVRTRAALEANQAGLDALQRVFARIGRDINRARNVRSDTAGNLSFTLAAPVTVNPATGESSVGTVEVVYLLAANQLVRRDPSGPGDEVLLDNGVEAWQGEVRRDDGNWGATPDNVTALPAGVRVSLRLAETGVLRRVFLVRE